MINWTPGTLRQFEEEIQKVFLTGCIWAPIHLSGGDEEALIEIFKEVSPADWVCSTHRSHFHALLKGIPEEWVRREILEGRSIHLNNAEHHFISSAIVGGIMPLAVGLAMAIKLKGEDRKVWAFIGDMAWEAGITFESVKYARNFDLPLCVVVECNRFGTNTPTDEAWGFRHDHRPEAGVKVVERWAQGKALLYCYNRIFAHINAGAFVIFR